MIKHTIAAAIAAATLAAGAAQAQSHSTTNMANPPQGEADTKAGTKATPSHTATADRQDARNASDNKPNGTWKPPVGKPTDDKGKVRNDISAAQAGNEAKETMQVDPSESKVDPATRHALDVSTHGKK